MSCLNSYSCHYFGLFILILLETSLSGFTSLFLIFFFYLASHSWQHVYLLLPTCQCWSLLSFLSFSLSSRILSVMKVPIQRGENLGVSISVERVCFFFCRNYDCLFDLNLLFLLWGFYSVWSLFKWYCIAETLYSC